MESIDKLTEEVFQKFGDRKREGRLDLVYDALNGNFYPVPRGMEHSEFTPSIKGCPEALIPVQLRTEKREGQRCITELLVGASSYEVVHEVGHPCKYLKAAYDAVFAIIEDNFPLELRRSKIFHTFAERTTR